MATRKKGTAAAKAAKKKATVRTKSKDAAAMAATKGDSAKGSAKQGVTAGKTTGTNAATDRKKVPAPKRAAKKKDAATAAGKKPPRQPRSAGAAAPKAPRVEETARKQAGKKRAGRTTTVAKKRAVSRSSVTKVVPRKTASVKGVARVVAAPGRGSSSGPRYFFKASIPEQYGETYLIALPRDPEWIYTYWEIDQDTLNKIKHRTGEDSFAAAKRILRLLDVTGIDYDGSNAWTHTDIEITPFADNWYIKVPESGRSYVVEHALLTPEGAYVIIERSNPVEVPCDGVSEVMADEWSTVDTEQLIRVSAASSDVAMGSSERVQAATSRLNLNAPSSR